MDDFGLTEDTFRQIRGVLQGTPAVTSAAIFGSRAMGTAISQSDIDIVLYGRPSWDALGSVRAGLEELPIPQKCDVQFYDLIQSQELREHIDTWGKVFYEAAEGVAHAWRSSDNGR